ncbi:MAG: glutamine--fructose-6-phosphate transaminase (isomerizing) [Fimbriimonadaceae bacterium]|nr:glutamine--fructose-6-phosphate transaminase (isomerizing) [Fimbriimonadaceae bacterium]
MCGIVGYIGPRSAVPIIVESLRRLEYRGYDSAGVAVLDEGACKVVKSVGKINNLAELLDQEPLEVKIGIGHTRWATHGRPSTRNAHPHTGNSGKLAVVHNGIIENYVELRERLTAAGANFTSDTDTEVIAHLLEEKLTNGAGGDMLEALRLASREMHGAYAVAVVSESCPDRLHVVRKESPLVLGLGQGEVYIASDITAVLPYTKTVMVLEDGDVGVLTVDGVSITGLDGRAIDRKVLEVEWDVGAAEKGGYDHYMIKEIHEIPDAIRHTMRGRVTPEGLLNITELNLSADEIRDLKRIYIVACGTSYYAGVVGKYLFERLLRIPTEVDVASEFRYRDPVFEPNSLMIVISQSGETADTLAALREAQRHNVKVLAIVNVIGSSMYRDADAVFPTLAGPEICVASTKAYVTQLVCEYLLAFHFARLRGQMADAEVNRLVAEMLAVPAKVQQILAQEDDYKTLAKNFLESQDFFFLGRGLDAAVSLEGALKLKEISYIHAESYAAGELKHGPLALMWDDVPVFVTATQTDLYEKTVSNIKEVKARRADVLALVRESNVDIAQHVDWVIKVPDADNLVMPFLTIIPPYLLTYWLSFALDREIDQPRNLAKSVTVE